MIPIFSDGGDNEVETHFGHESQLTWIAGWRAQQHAKPGRQGSYYHEECHISKMEDFRDWGLGGLERGDIFCQNKFPDWWLTWVYSSGVALKYVSHMAPEREIVKCRYEPDPWTMAWGLLFLLPLWAWYRVKWVLGARETSFGETWEWFLQETTDRFFFASDACKMHPQCIWRAFFKVPPTALYPRPHQCLSVPPIQSLLPLTLSITMPRLAPRQTTVVPTDWLIWSDGSGGGATLGFLIEIHILKKKSKISWTWPFWPEIYETVHFTKSFGAGNFEVKVKIWVVRGFKLFHTKISYNKLWTRSFY